jgi:hypothetical protein
MGQCNFVGDGMVVIYGFIASAPSQLASEQQVLCRLWPTSVGFADYELRCSVSSTFLVIIGASLSDSLVRAVAFFEMYCADFSGHSLGVVYQTASAVCQIDHNATILNKIHSAGHVAPREMLLKLTIISRETSKLAHTWHLMLL